MTASDRRTLSAWSFWLWLGWFFCRAFGLTLLDGLFLLAFLFVLLARVVVWFDEKVRR